MVDRGFDTYSNEAKQDLLGVPAATLAAHGAVSEPTARAMAEGALARSRAHVTVAITGVAGPGGGSAEKPVGLVHFGCARRGSKTQTLEKRFGDLGRTEVRRAALLFALDLLEGRLYPMGPRRRSAALRSRSMHPPRTDSRILCLPYRSCIMGGQVGSRARRSR